MHVRIVPPETELIKPSDWVEERKLLSKELLTNAKARDKPDPSLNFKDQALQAALSILMMLMRVTSSSWKS